MKVYLNEITGLAPAMVSLLMSKRSWTREKEQQIYQLVRTCTDERGAVRAEVPEEFIKKMESIITWGVYGVYDRSKINGHTTLLRYIDLCFTVEGLHRYGQDDLDSHAKRMDNRIVRSSTRLAKFSDGEKSDYYKGKILYPFEAFKKLGINIPETLIDDNYIVNSISLDLLAPYNPTLEISKRKSSLSQTISDIHTETITNNGVYNNVQIGSAYGIRAVRSDGKVVTTINATDGITIENQNEKVFYVDGDGKLTAVNIQAKGGDFRRIKVNTGEFRDIIVKDGIIIEDGDLTCNIDSTGIELTGPNGKTAKIEILDDGTYSGTYIRDDLYVEDVLRVFGRMNVEGSLYVGGTNIYNLIDERIEAHGGGGNNEE